MNVILRPGDYLVLLNHCDKTGEDINYIADGLDRGTHKIKVGKCYSSEIVCVADTREDGE